MRSMLHLSSAYSDPAAPLGFASSIGRAELAADRRDVELHGLIADVETSPRWPCSGRPSASSSSTCISRGVSASIRTVLAVVPASRRAATGSRRRRRCVWPERSASASRDDRQSGVRAALAPLRAVARRRRRERRVRPRDAVAHDRGQELSASDRLSPMVTVTSLCGAAAQDAHGHGVACRSSVQHLEQIHRRLYRTPIERHQHVADEQPGRIRRAPLRDGDDQQRVRGSSCRAAFAEPHRLAGQAEIAALRRTVLDERCGDRSAMSAGMITPSPRISAAVAMPISAPVTSTNAPPAKPSCIGAVVRITRSIARPRPVRSGPPMTDDDARAHREGVAPRPREREREVSDASRCRRDAR